jgi:hypothetical protein
VKRLLARLGEIKSEWWFSIGAIIVSLAAFTLSVNESILNRREIRLAALPRLRVASSHAKDRVSITATNDGLGPAVVKFLEIEVDGKLVASWDDLIDSLQILAPSDSIRITTLGMFPGQIIREGTSRTLGRFEGGGISYGLVKSRARWRLRVCYCSVYGECWLTGIAVSLDHGPYGSPNRCVRSQRHLFDTPIDSAEQLVN